MELPCLSGERGREGGELVGAGAGDGPLPAWVHSCGEQSCLTLLVFLSLHIWCVGWGWEGLGHVVLCCFVLGSAWLQDFWPGYAGVGLDLRLRNRPTAVPTQMSRAPSV